MALSQSDLIRLLESLRTVDGVETIRVLCERILQELIEAEATEAIGAAAGEHSAQRTTWHNGHRAHRPSPPTCRHGWRPHGGWQHSHGERRSGRSACRRGGYRSRSRCLECPGVGLTEQPCCCAWGGRPIVSMLPGQDRLARTPSERIRPAPAPAGQRTGGPDLVLVVGVHEAKHVRVAGLPLPGCDELATQAAQLPCEHGGGVVPRRQAQVVQ